MKNILVNKIKFKGIHARMVAAIATVAVASTFLCGCEYIDGVLEKFDKIIGIDRLKAIHLNDSLNPCGAHKDRHARIGEGCIGADALIRVINHPGLRGLPVILETPNDLDGYAREIQFLRHNYSEEA